MNDAISMNKFAIEISSDWRDLKRAKLSCIAARVINLNFMDNLVKLEMLMLNVSISNLFYN